MAITPLVPWFMDRNDLKDDIERLFENLQRLEEKVDKLAFSPTRALILAYLQKNKPAGT